MRIFGSRKARRGAPGAGTSRVYVVAFAAAAIALCLGGAVAIAAAVQGASAAQSLSLLAGFVLWGALAAAGLVLLDGRQDREQPVGRLTRRDRREMRRTEKAMRRSKECSPELLLAEQLSARYGVPVERVAWHVWRIDGELVEATFDPTTGQLMTGGRELQP